MAPLSPAEILAIFASQLVFSTLGAAVAAAHSVFPCKTGNSNSNLLLSAAAHCLWLSSWLNPLLLLRKSFLTASSGGRGEWAESRIPRGLYLMPSPQVAESSLSNWNSPPPLLNLKSPWLQGECFGSSTSWALTPTAAAGGGSTAGCKSFSSLVCSGPQVQQHCPWKPGPRLPPCLQCWHWSQRELQLENGDGIQTLLNVLTSRKSDKERNTMFCES